jgi:aryl-alcohol dehydrogenase-like predicted oxidoreductase
MKTRRLGRSGLEVSIVGIGCNNFGGRSGPEATRAVISKALDCGITLFDTADVYGERGGSESLMGEFLGARRKEIVLASKFGLPMDQGRKKGGSRRYIMEAVEASLKRLRTDWLDLYQMHQPDPATPIEETLRALDDLVRQGKVRYIGCSNFAGWQLTDALWTSRMGGLEQFISCQNEYSLVERGIEAELVPAMQHHGASLLPFYPLAGGLLTGKYFDDPQAQGRLTAFPAMAKRHMNERKRTIAGQLDAYAKSQGHTLLELSMSWLANLPYVGSVIAGASNPAQVEANVKSVSWAMSAQDMAEIDRITRS